QRVVAGINEVGPTQVLAGVALDLSRVLHGVRPHLESLAAVEGAGQEHGPIAEHAVGFAAEPWGRIDELFILRGATGAEQRGKTEGGNIAGRKCAHGDLGRANSVPTDPA